MASCCAVRGQQWISASLRNYRGNQGVGVNRKYESYLHDCALVNPCLSTCGQQDLVLSNGSVVYCPLEKTW